MLPRVEDETNPRDVPGFSSALSSGIIVPVPETMPRFVPGSTALARFRLSIILMLGGGALVIAAVQGLALLIPVTSWTRPVVVMPALAWFFAGIWGLHRVGDRAYEEFTAGYTTLRLAFGGFRVGRWRRWQQIDHRTPWDYRGLWVLDGRGGLIAPPDRSILPPGFYPSPNRPGQLELWTGRVWMGEYRRP